MNPWNRGRPTNFQELFLFYHGYVKTLYSSVQTQNTLPIETLFELNAAFDHITNHWTFGITEEQATSDAFSHLKRSCLDIFKIKVRDAREQYDFLGKLDTSVIDNGDFDKQLHKLFNEIREGAIEARRTENETDSNELVPAFERWQKVYINCVKLEKDFFLHSKVNWVKKRGVITFIRQNAWGFVIGVVSSLVGTWIWLLLTGH